jgi:hypothetical protein
MPRSEHGGRGASASLSAQALVPEDLTRRLFAEIRRRPARSLALALGAGYIAGGGIGTILTARLLAMGARLAMRMAVVPLLADGVQRTLFPGRANQSNNASA